jgi:hypothetical protein
MFVVGLHREMQVGIAYTQFGGEFLTINIVASSGYEDSEDYEDIYHYIQQGGKRLERQKASG